MWSGPDRLPLSRGRLLGRLSPLAGSAQRFETGREVAQLRRLLGDPVATKAGGLLGDRLAYLDDVVDVALGVGAPAIVAACSVPSLWRPNITVPISPLRMPPAS